MEDHHLVSDSLLAPSPNKLKLTSQYLANEASVYPSYGASIIVNMDGMNVGTDTTLSTSTDASSVSDSTHLSPSPSPPSLLSVSDGQSSQEFEGPDDTGNEATDNRPGQFQRILFSALVDPRGCPKTKRFFPNTVFTELISEMLVLRELQHCFEYLDPVEMRRLTRIICGAGSFKKIFALLALVDKVSDIRCFIEQNVADIDLPLRKIALPASNIFTLGCHVDPENYTQPVECLNNWNPATIRMFEEWQWSTLAPTFQRGETKDIKHIALPDDMPLPFTADSQYEKDSKMIQGGYSTVSKVVIHPAHHYFNDSENTFGGTFAVKRLLSRNKAQFDREVEMLMTFSGNANPHLVSLLATYEQYNEYYLIFPWAGGDLQSFWREVKPAPSVTHDTILWMAEQCLGIARGLSVLHKHQTLNTNRLKSVFVQHEFGQHEVTDTEVWPLFGVHGDIKPQNILWFKDDSSSEDRGTLKISDFGLAEFKTSATKIYRPSSKVLVSASYRPPECELKSGSVGQSQDIWALGCLYLEMVAWLLGGWKLVHSFQHRRAANEGFSFYSNVADAAFFKIESVEKDGTASVTVKPAVIEFIDYLRDLPAATKYLHCFLDIIQKEMLIIKPKTQYEKGRIKAAELVAKLNVLWKYCENVEFATMPVCP